MHRQSVRTTLALLALLALLTPPLAAQLELPRTSQKAHITQTIGVTDIEIVYSRPGVKEREIWGDLVPYGEVWRTGANENTTISFEHDVTVEGEPLPAGTYGLHTIPGEETWTIIFSADNDQWGSFSYDEANDALRVEVEPRSAPHKEWMAFEFGKLAADSAEVAIRWAELAVPFTVEVQTTDNVLEAVSSTLRWQSFLQAAGYCQGTEACQDQAAKWIEAAMVLERNFWTLRAKAQLLAAQGDSAGAVEAAEDALGMLDELSQKPPQRFIDQFKEQIDEWREQ